MIRTGTLLNKWGEKRALDYEVCFKEWSLTVLNQRQLQAKIWTHPKYSLHSADNCHYPFSHKRINFSSCIGAKFATPQDYFWILAGEGRTWGTNNQPKQIPVAWQFGRRSSSQEGCFHLLEMGNTSVRPKDPIACGVQDSDGLGVVSPHIEREAASPQGPTLISPRAHTYTHTQARELCCWQGVPVLTETQRTEISNHTPKSPKRQENST